jgi:hypothetical protein
MGAWRNDPVFVGLQACDYCRVVGNPGPVADCLFAVWAPIFQVFPDPKFEPEK